MMSTSKKVTRALGFAVVLAGLASSTSAWASPGMSIDSAKLPAQSRTELRMSIDKARASDPAAFRDVREIVVHAREADLRARGRKAPISQALAGMGAKALMPLLELAAFDAPAQAGQSPSDRASVQCDVVEAIGLLRDVRATPVLVAILARENDFEQTRTAAEALARMETNDAAGALVTALAASSGERSTAILAGMGSCHRAAIARTLADRLAARPDDATAKHIVKSLGHAGNAWAWKTLADRSDEGVARETAARALLSAFVHYTGETRDAAAKALLVVDDVHTPALVEAARRAATSSDLALALDELARSLAASPIRR